jgi:hypothetical protein
VLDRPGGKGKLSPTPLTPLPPYPSGMLRDPTGKGVIKKTGIVRAKLAQSLFFRLEQEISRGQGKKDRRERSLRYSKEPGNLKA